MIVHLCSSNPGKLREFALAAAGTRLTVEPLPGLQQIAPPEENGITFGENAVDKALYYSQFSDGLVLADDSGLEVDALHGEPGVLSARYAGKGASDEENNALLLQRMKGLTARSARFVCVIAVARRGTPILTVHGVVEGEILRDPRGTGGFGYDPLFYYPALHRSFGELTPEEKLEVSHRGKALHAAFLRLGALETSMQAGA